MSWNKLMPMVLSPWEDWKVKKALVSREWNNIPEETSPTVADVTSSPHASTANAVASSPYWPKWHHATLLSRGECCAFSDCFENLSHTHSHHATRDAQY